MRDENSKTLKSGNGRIRFPYILKSIKIYILTFFLQTSNVHINDAKVK